MNAPNELSVALTIPESVKTQMAGSNGAVTLADDFTIDCPEMAQMAADNMNLAKQASAALDQQRKHILEPLDELVRRVNSFFAPAITGFKNAEQIYKKKLTAWQTQEAKRIEDERRAAEEVARRARQEAEQRAAAERARAQAIADAKRREAEEAERKRAQAEAEGNARAAAAAAAAAARASQAAESAVQNAEAKAQAVELEAAAVASAVVPAETSAKIGGFTTRENFVAELQPDWTGTQARDAIIKACVERPDLAVFLDLNWKALNNAAKTYKGELKIPGIVAVDRRIAAGSRKG